MFRWIPFVMVRVVLCFAAGILLGYYCPDRVEESTLQRVLLLLVIGYSISWRLLKRNDYRGSVTGCLGLIAIILAGDLALLNATSIRRTYHFSKTQSFSYYSGVVAAVEIKGVTTKVELGVEKIYATGKWKPVTGNVLLYTPQQSSLALLKCGDRIIVGGMPSEVSAPANPGEFDLKTYLNLKRINHLHRVAADHIRILGSDPGQGVLARSREAREWASSTIKKWVKGSREQAITLALVLGFTDGIDNDLQDAYSASGAMHVLSVSGLHVGIIYSIILLLMKPLAAFAWSRWAVAVVSFSCLWIYAFITGLSPSVLRAVMMFSFLVLARPFGRNTNIYNTLAASAFLLLLYNPFLLFSVGFQLSYLAVLGIVYLQPPLYRWWEPSSAVLDKLWQLTTVSLAAQAATFALGLFYFHQFPVYFLLSNMLVIPVSTGVLVAGIVLLVVSPFASLASLTSWAVEWLVRVLNGCVFTIEKLPLSTINHVHISALQCWVLLLISISFILLVQFRQRRMVLAASVLLIVFGVLDWLHFLADVDKYQLVVYSIPHHSVIETIDHGKARLYSDSSLLADQRSIRYHIRPYRVISGVGLADHRPLAPKSHPALTYVTLNGRSVLIVDQPGTDLPEVVSADYLIIGNNAVTSLRALAARIRFKELILTSSNSDTFIEDLTKEAAGMAIETHSVKNNKAFITNF